jgi:DNA uptake protein ComE-like DNA-binding protein
MTYGMRSALTTLALLPLLGLAACGGDEAVEDADVPEGEAVEDTAMAPADEGAATTTGAGTEGALLNPDQVTMAELMALPAIDHELAAGIVDGRPWTDMVQLDQVLAGSLDDVQREELYRHLWKPIDLNTASEEEILLIPGVGERMLHEFQEYRPYRAMAEFHREIGKYVDDAELERLARYVEVRE